MTASVKKLMQWPPPLWPSTTSSSTFGLVLVVLLVVVLVVVVITVTDYRAFILTTQQVRYDNYDSTVNLL